MKLILVFFIALLSFSIGTYVGKKFTENQYKLSRLEAPSHSDEATAEPERDVASVHHEALDVKPKQALNDDEIKKLAEEFVSDDEAPKSANKNGTATSAKSEQNDNVDQVANRVAAGMAPETVEKKVHVAKSRIPQSLPKDVAAAAAGKYTVQVASYPDEIDAKNAATDLKNKGFSAFYITAKIADKKSQEEKTWYRVSVGLFTTQKEAELYKKDLVSRAKVTTAIIQKITK